MTTSACGCCVLRRLRQLLQDRERARDHAQRFGQAGDRQAVEVGDQPPAGRGEALAAEAEDVDVRLAAAQRLDQRARVQITGGLAARQQKPGHSGRGAPARFRKSADIRSRRSIGMRS